MKHIIITLLITLSVTTINLSAAEPTYSVESLPGIYEELAKKEYEQPVTDWLSKHRPAQFKRLFGEENEKPKDEKQTDKGIISILSELNTAAAGQHSMLLDFYINSKASAGWDLVSITDRLIVFRRSAEDSDKPDSGE